MVLFILSIALLLGAILLIVLNRPIDRISIKESIDLCNLPVITFKNGNNKFNFLLDTGADSNHMGNKVLKTLEYKDTDYVLETTGFTGDTENNRIKVAVFEYKNRKFEVTFSASAGLDKSFEFVKKSTGVTIHGILGSAFLKEYRYILDFDKLEVYTRKRWRKK